MHLARLALPLVLSLAACSSGGAEPADGAGAPDAGEVDPDRAFGGDRPVKVRVPAGYDRAAPAPLVLLLHGYGASGLTQDIAVTHLADQADEKGFFLVAPDGTVDPTGKRFWNAWDACCDFSGTKVDDVAYLTGLVKEIQSVYAIDPRRIFAVGHSNGGFMAHRLACDAPGTFAAIVSLAGATTPDPALCTPSETVAVLQAHGDADDTVLYEGSQGSSGLLDFAYPGAEQTVAAWAAKNGCESAPSTQAGALDLVPTIDGKETDVTSYAGCKPGGDVALWRIRGAGHIPDFGSGFGKAVWAEWLSGHAKP